MTSRNLYQLRKKQFNSQAMQYNKYIFNSHFLLFLFISFGAFLLWYQQLIQNGEPHVYQRIAVSLIIGLVSVQSIRMYLKRADMLYLLPYEQHMSDYFNNTIVDSIKKLIVKKIIVALILSPLAMLEGLTGYQFILLIILIIILTTLMLLMKALLIISGYYRVVFDLVQVIVVSTIVLSSFYNTLISIVFISVCIMICSTLLYWIKHKKLLVNWGALIDYEMKLEESYYKFINMFVDVPHLGLRVKRRQWLDPIVSLLTPSNKGPLTIFEYVYVRSLVRGKELLFICIRLIVLAVIVMYLVRNVHVDTLVVTLCVYLIAIQLIQLFMQHRYGQWIEIWPIDERDQIRQFKRFYFKIMMAVIIILLVAFVIFHPSQFYYILIPIGILVYTYYVTTKKLVAQYYELSD